MNKGILHVESRPVSPEREAEYNTWYNEVHMPEVVALDGFVSARRFSTDEGSYICLYEIEAQEVDSAMQVLGAAFGAGSIHMSDSMQMDPAPTIRLLKFVADHQPTAVSTSS